MALLTGDNQIKQQDGRIKKIDSAQKSSKNSKLRFAEQEGGNA